MVDRRYVKSIITTSCTLNYLNGIPEIEIVNQYHNWCHKFFFRSSATPALHYIICIESMYGSITYWSRFNLRMISQEKRRLFFIYIVTVCFFIVFRIYIINSSSDQSDIPNSINHIKTLASIKYHERRSKIQDQCKKGNVNLLKVNADPKWKTALYFDYENNLIYCGISKVSSTTWTTNLMKYVFLKIWSW